MKTRIARAASVAILACGLAAPAAMAASESPPTAAATTVELEAEIRGELDALRERIEDLEVLLATLVASRGAEVPPADAEPGLALAAADAGASRGSGVPVPGDTGRRRGNARGRRQYRRAAAFHHRPGGHLLHPQRERPRRREQHALLHEPQRPGDSA